MGRAGKGPRKGKAGGKGPASKAAARGTSARRRGSARASKAAAGGAAAGESDMVAGSDESEAPGASFPFVSFPTGDALLDGVGAAPPFGAQGWEPSVSNNLDEETIAAVAQAVGQPEEMVQNVLSLMDRCIAQFMTLPEIEKQLMQMALVESNVVREVWRQLEVHQADFFRAYALCLKIRDQVDQFNTYCQHQIRGVQGGASAPNSAVGPASGVPGMAPDSAGGFGQGLFWSPYNSPFGPVSPNQVQLGGLRLPGMSGAISAPGFSGAAFAPLSGGNSLWGALSPPGHAAFFSPTGERHDGGNASPGGGSTGGGGGGGGGANSSFGSPGREVTDISQFFADAAAASVAPSADMA